MVPRKVPEGGKESLHMSHMVTMSLCGAVRWLDLPALGTCFGSLLLWNTFLCTPSVYPAKTRLGSVLAWMS